VAEDRLMAFWIAMASDPMKHEAFLRDAEAAMDAAGLDAAERDVVRSGNARTIYTRLTDPALPSAPPAPAALPGKD
jgi:hypothetical protein